MIRPAVLSLCCLVLTACVSSEPAAQGAGFSGGAGTAPKQQPVAVDGWTRVEGPVAYDDGTLLRGKLTISAQGNMRQATLTETWRSRSLYIGAKRGAEAFSASMMARTGCRPEGSVQGNGKGDLRMFLTCD